MENIIGNINKIANNLSDTSKLIFNAGAEALSEYADPTTERAPVVKLLFSPFGLPYVPIEILSSNVGGMITSMSWTKDRNNAGGILSCILTPDPHSVEEIVKIIDKYSGNLYTSIWGKLGVDLEDLFKPMTYCQLKIDEYSVMCGTVKSCKRSASAGNDEYSVSYELVIEELGMLYERITSSWDLIITDALNLNALDSHNPTQVVLGQKMIHADEALTNLLNAFIGMVWANGMTLSDGLPLPLRLLNLSGQIGGIADVSFCNNISCNTNPFQVGGGQSFWGMLKQVIPTPWCELFTESGGRTIVKNPIGVPAVLLPGFNYPVMRSVPYSNPLLGTINPVHWLNTLFYDLTAPAMLAGGDFVIVTDSMIVDKELGVDCSAQATVFHTRYESAAGMNPSMDKPIHALGPLSPFASGGIFTFGVKEMFQSVNVINQSEFATPQDKIYNSLLNSFGAPGAPSKKALSNLLAVWFRNQSKFREGSITTRYLPYARAGMYCLYLPELNGRAPENLRDIGLYYIDSLSHNYALTNSGMSFTTTLNVIRGVPMPATIAQTALLLFDFEILPPESGIGDGSYKTSSLLASIKRGIKIG